MRVEVPICWNGILTTVGSGIESGQKHEIADLGVESKKYDWLSSEYRCLGRILPKTTPESKKKMMWRGELCIKSVETSRVLVVSGK